MYYLDNAATTELHPEVVSVMIDYLKNEFGNPSSKYYPQALSAKKYLSEAREQVAKLLNCDPEYILFTSGSTESNNFVLKGVAEKFQNTGRHIITSRIEHKSVLETCKHLERMGFEVTYLKVNNEGHINLEELENEIRKDTILVSLMWGNNEIGVINEIEKISKICRDKNVLFHTDATQVLGKVEVNLKKSPVDFLSISAHKLRGPKGIGAVYVGPDDLGLRRRIPSLLDGGDQEYKMRAGTHSMHNIVGLGKACEIASTSIVNDVPKIIKQEINLKQELLKLRPDITFNGDQIHKIPGLFSLNIPGINNELFCKQISNSIALSTGSACSFDERSYVLESINMEDTSMTLRIALSYPLINIEELINIIEPYLKKINV